MRKAGRSDASRLFLFPRWPRQFAGTAGGLKAHLAPGYIHPDNYKLEEMADSIARDYGFEFEEGDADE